MELKEVKEVYQSAYGSRRRTENAGSRAKPRTWSRTVSASLESEAISWLPEDFPEDLRQDYSRITDSMVSCLVLPPKCKQRCESFRACGWKWKISILNSASGSQPLLRTTHRSGRLLITSLPLVAQSPFEATTRFVQLSER